MASTATDDVLRAARPRATLEEHTALAELRARLFGGHARTRLQRYELMHRLGGGGTAVVFAARDPQLRRDVAIKLQHVDGSLDERGRRRLLLEARLLADLHHPNLVELYDVGEYGEGDLPADAGDVAQSGVFVVMQLVRGRDLADWLAAAQHPVDEILARFVAAGRGLAHAHAHGVVHRDFKPANVLVGDDGSVRVGDFGLAGTPAYMAPEQHAGEDVDARADQFAFCAALVEAITGTRPCGARGSGRVVVADVPRRWRAALTRGLQRDPADRFASMSELLGALQTRRRRWPYAAAGLGMAAVLGWRALPDRGDPLPSTRHGVHAVVELVGTSVGSALAHGRDRGAHRRAVQDAIARAEALQLAGRDDAAATELRAAQSIAASADDRALHAEVAVRRAFLLERTGEIAESSRVLQDAFFEARTHHAPAVAARAAAMLVAAAGREGSLQRVHEWSRHARVEIDRMSGDAGLEEMLASNLGIASMLCGELEESAVQLRRALDLHAPLAPAGDLQTAAYLDNLGAVLQDLDRAGEAEPLHRRAREILERELGSRHPRLVTVLCNLSRLAHDTDRPAEAHARARAAWTIVAQTDRPQPQVVVTVQVALGMSALALDRPAEALLAFERALAELAADVPGDDPQVLRLRTMIAMTHARAGRIGRARDDARALIDSFVASGRQDDPAVIELRALLARR